MQIKKTISHHLWLNVRSTGYQYDEKFLSGGLFLESVILFYIIDVHDSDGFVYPNIYNASVIYKSNDDTYKMQGLRMAVDIYPLK